MTSAREIALQINLRDGQQHRLTLLEDAPALRTLLASLVDPTANAHLLQLPDRGGAIACSFHSSQLVSIVSTPAVVLNFDETLPAPRVCPRRSGQVIIDDFLNLQEQHELRAFAMTPESQGLAFGATLPGRRFQNRLLMWLPLLAKTLGFRMFALAPLESRLDASDGGDDFQPSSAEAFEDPEGLILTCIYELGDGPVAPLSPAANRLQVFLSHDLTPVRRPSNPDRRFVVTTWLRRAPRLDPTMRFGLGHFRCAVVAPQHAGFDTREGPS